MYEISTRPWLYELSQKYGYNISTLRDIPMEELKALAVQGVTYVWFMGVCILYSQSPNVIKDVGTWRLWLES